MDAEVTSWRDANGNEVDAIVSAGPNTWGAFDIKLNPDDVDKAAASLLRFAKGVETSRHGEPSCLGVITSTGVGGLRDDGVHVIPIGCLDRKSTRLNSSHVSSSYAVFCLEQKNT